MKILLDTNVWRYLVDSGQQDSLYGHAKRFDVEVAISPNILIETMRLGNLELRRKIIELQTRDCWLRLMPDAYLECVEMKEEMLRCRPHWALIKKDTARFRKLRYDWIRSKGGFWHKARINTESVAAAYASQDRAILEKAREQAKTTRDAVLKKGHAILGSGPLAEIDGSWTLKDGQRVKTDFWRVYCSGAWETMLALDSVWRQWLSCDLDINLLFTLFAEEYIDFWANEIQSSSVPRAWIRAAMFVLQSERKITDGTPTDAAIAVHLPDVDLIVSADKNFVSMANRCNVESPTKIGSAFLVQGGDTGIQQLFELISSS